MLNFGRPIVKGTPEVSDRMQTSGRFKEMTQCKSFEMQSTGRRLCWWLEMAGTQYRCALRGCVPVPLLPRSFPRLQMRPRSRSRLPGAFARQVWCLYEIFNSIQLQATIGFSVATGSYQSYLKTVSRARQGCKLGWKSWLFEKVVRRRRDGHSAAPPLDLQ